MDYCYLIVVQPSTYSEIESRMTQIDAALTSGYQTGCQHRWSSVERKNVTIMGRPFFRNNFCARRVLVIKKSAKMLTSVYDRRIVKTKDAFDTTVTPWSTKPFLFKKSKQNKKVQIGLYPLRSPTEGRLMMSARQQGERSLLIPVSRMSCLASNSQVGRSSLLH